MYQAEGEYGTVYRVPLKEDHTGTLKLQDSIEVLWGESIGFDARYSYTVDGNSLYLEIDGEWIGFARHITE